MFIGGMLGGACGQFFDHWIPGAHIEPAAFVLVGMGGFFAGVSKTPLTSIVMVSEMTGSYSLLVPLMLACALNMAISRRWTIYEEQVSPIDSSPHRVPSSWTSWNSSPSLMSASARSVWRSFGHRCRFVS